MVALALIEGDHSVFGMLALTPIGYSRVMSDSKEPSSSGGNAPGPAASVSDLTKSGRSIREQSREESQGLEKPPTATLQIDEGACRVLLAFDVGMSIDLAGATRLLTAARRPETIRHRRRTPEYFGFENVPVQVPQEGTAIKIDQFETLPCAELVLFEFGAIGVRYELLLSGRFESLVGLSSSLYEHPGLLADARGRVERLLREIEPAVRKPQIAGFVEDYVIVHLKRVSILDQGGGQPGVSRAVPSDKAANGAAGFITEMLGESSGLAARVLRAESGPLSRSEVADAISARVSYRPNDLLLIDYNGAILVSDGESGDDVSDVIAVLEYANIELLEMRYLDHRLDTAMEQVSAAEALRQARGFRVWWPAALGGGMSRGEGRRSPESIAELQIDGARLFEEVNNSLKLLGDQYLARVYRLASERLHLPEWDAAILRKLDTLESVYQKMSDFRTSRRLETLEWIVILLIAFEVVMSLVRGECG